jgi:hypothetical protein
MAQYNALTNYMSVRSRALRRLVQKHKLDPRMIGDMPSWFKKSPRDNHKFCFHPGVTNSVEWSHELAQKVVPRFHQLESDSKADDYGLTGFDRLLNFPGFSMSPIGRPHMEPEVQDSRLNDALIKGHLACARLLGPILRNALKTKAKLKARHGANTGDPLFSTDTRLKGVLFDFWIKNIDLFVHMLEADDYEGLLCEFGCTVAAYVRRRHQSDGVKVEWSRDGWRIIGVEPKVRMVYDELGLPAVEADKHIHTRVKGMSEFVVANRERNVIAINFIANAPEVILSSCFDDVAAEFSHHWHVGNALAELLSYPDLYKDRIPFAADVVRWDFHQPLSYLDFQVRTYYRAIGLKPWVVKLSLLTNAPPLISPPVGITYESQPKLIGDPMHPDDNREERACGEPSGKGNTAWLYNKISNGVACWVAWCLVLNRAITIDSLRSYLSFDREWPVWCWNCGDDINFWIDPARITEVQRKEFITQYKSLCTCWDISYDDLPSFLSYQVRRSSSLWTAYPDAARSTTNIFDRESALPQLMADQLNPNPEMFMSLQGVTGVQNDLIAQSAGRFANYGYRMRSAHHRAENPAWAEIEQIIDSALEEFAPGCTRARERYADLEESALEAITVNAQSAIPYEILDNPAYVYYRPEYDDITIDSYRDVLFLSYNHEQIKPVIDAMLVPDAEYELTMKEAA